MAGYWIGVCMDTGGSIDFMFCLQNYGFSEVS